MLYLIAGKGPYLDEIKKYVRILKLDHHPDPVFGQIEQHACLNHLKPLVHHGGGVYRDFRPHGPVRVIDGLLRGCGLHQIVQFVKNQKHFSDFFDTINDLFNKMLSGFKDEGKDYITVAFGCTGGVHRSVVSSEMFFLNLKKNKNLEVFIVR